ncbi:MAG TPA: YihY/virulence factor BrkB family protein [Nitrospiraceae bacterium]|nr:YihY/virulence factor BrkB family protein [Nitrospiraceae bacterium]
MEEKRWSKLIRPASLWGMLKQTFTDWSNDKVPRLGAALAYYTVFAIVPLLIIIIAIIGLVFGEEAAQSYIFDQIAGLVGEQSANAIKDMIHRADKPSTGIIATVIAAVTLLFGASGLFGQLQDALNTIWGVEPKPGRGIWGLIKDRFLSFMAVLGTGFLLLVSLVLSAALAALGKWFGGWLPAPEVVLQALNFLISFGVITALFAMMFKLLPDAKVAWSDVWVGAAITALLFTLGKFLIGLYLGKSDVGSAYGAAGSLVIVLLWVYYSAQILLFGAEFTQVYANTSGAKIVPSEQAIAVDQKKAGGKADSGSPAGPGRDTSRLPDGQPARPAAAASRTSSRSMQERAADMAARFKDGLGPSRSLAQSDRWFGALFLALSMFQLMRGQAGARRNQRSGRS